MELSNKLRELRTRRGVTQEKLAVLASDWDTTEGETADVVRRHIARLK